MHKLVYSYLEFGIFQYSTEYWKYAHLAEVNIYSFPSFSSAFFKKFKHMYVLFSGITNNIKSNS